MNKLPKIITQEEFEKLYTHISKEKPPNFKQHQLCLLLGFEAGMRISEIVGWKDRVPALTQEKIDLVNRSIRIESGKGQKDRIVPLPKRINDSMIKLLPITLKRRAIQEFITKHAREVLQKEITFHTLRAGFITHLMNMGVPIHQVMLLAGHSKMETTGIYARANPTQSLENARRVFG